MIRLICAIAATSLWAGAISAQTTGAPEENWNWQAEFNLNGLKIKQSGNACTSADTLETDLAELALGFDEACGIFGWNEREHETNFALACLGDQVIDMAGVLTVSGDAARMDLTGDVRLPETSPLDANGVITATSTGACALPAEEASPEPMPVAATLPPPPRLPAETVEAAAGTAPVMEPAVAEAPIAEAPVAEAPIAETSVKMVEPVETEAEAEPAPTGIVVETSSVEANPVAQIDAMTAEAQLMPAAMDDALEPLPQAALVPAAPITAPIPVEDAS